MHKPVAAIAALIPATLLLTGCGAGGSPKERTLARCERSFARMAPDPAAGQALCSCLVDRLEAEGISILETMGDGRGTEIARECAAQVGVSLPESG